MVYNEKQQVGKKEIQNVQISEEKSLMLQPRYVLKDKF